jgi:hypothetical protein
MSIGQYSSGGRIFDADRNVQSAPRYSKFELTTTIEYGATSWLTMILVPQLQRIDVGSPVDAHRAGFGYTELGGRVQLYDGGTSAFSVQATARIHGTTTTSIRLRSDIPIISSRFARCGDRPLR